MVIKADMSRDYYADLDLPLGASEADIKKSFKKLALKYHPDRNPGRESEVNSMFQTINTAHEVLTDPDQKAKYDSNRIRSAGGRNGAAGGSAYSGFRTGGHARGNPYSSAGSQWAPPPKPPQSRPKQPPPASAGATRYSNFKTPNAGAKTQDAETNKKNWEAWNNMRGSPKQPQFHPPPPKPVPKEYTPQSGREESNSFKHPPPPRSSKPGFEEFRSGAASFGNPQRPQPPGPAAKKGGFAPNTPGGDEPAATSSSAYFTHRSRPSTSSTGGPATSDQSDVPPVPPRMRPEPKVFRDDRSNDDEMGTPLGPRLSTPYARQGGEKLNPFENINVNRAKSTKERPTGSFSHGERHRSASPPRTRMHRNLSPDSVPRSGSDANIQNNATSPKRTFSRANHKPTPPGEQRSQPRFEPTVIDDSSSESEEEIRPAAPRVFAKGRPRRKDTTQQSQAGSYGGEESLRSSNRNGSTSSGGGVKATSPTYETPKNVTIPAMQSSSKYSLLSTIHEDRASWPSDPDEEPKSSNFERTASHPASASSEVPIPEIFNKPSSIASEPLSSAPESPIGVSTTTRGVLNAFETTQFRLLEELVNRGEVKFRNSEASVNEQSSAFFGKYQMRRTNMARKNAETAKISPLQNSYAKMHMADCSDHELGCPFKKSRGLETAYRRPLCPWVKSVEPTLAADQPQLFSSVRSCDPNQTSHGAWSLKTTNTFTRSSQANYHSSSSFSFKTGNEAFPSDRPHSTRFTGNSEENISTNFTSEDWLPKFEAGDYFTGGAKGPPRAHSGTRNGRRSPTKRPPRRPNVQSRPYVPNIDPDVLGQPKEDDETSASPGGTRFKPEEWASTFQPQTFEFPPSPSAGSAPSRRNPVRRPTRMGSSTSKGPSVSKTAGSAAIVDEDSSSDDPIYMGTRKAPASSGTVPSVGIDSPNAMDIDPPLEQQPDVRQQGFQAFAKAANESHHHEPRNVPVEPTNPAWRDPPSNGNLSENSRKVPDPPLPPRSPANTSKPRGTKVGEDDGLKVKLDDLKDVEPMKQPATGLDSFSDLTSHLPFPSKAAASVPLSQSVATGRMNLPHPPKAPEPPNPAAEDIIRPTQHDWLTYLAHFKAYMKAWAEFDEKMIMHFVARRNYINHMDENWVAEFGDGKLQNYKKWLGEDQVVREWWDEAARRHAAKMDEFGGWKKLMRDGPGASRII